MAWDIGAADLALYGCIFLLGFVFGRIAMAIQAAFMKTFAEEKRRQKEFS